MLTGTRARLGPPDRDPAKDGCGVWEKTDVRSQRNSRVDLPSSKVVRVPSQVPGLGEDRVNEAPEVTTLAESVVRHIVGASILSVNVFFPIYFFCATLTRIRATTYVLHKAVLLGDEVRADPLAYADALWMPDALGNESLWCLQSALLVSCMCRDRERAGADPFADERDRRRSGRRPARM